MSDNTFKAKATKVWGSLRKWYVVRKAVFSHRCGKFRKARRNFFKSKDYKAFSSAVVKMFLNGLFISGLMYYFIGFHWALIPAFGTGWFFLKRELLPQLRTLIASINLIKIGR